MATDRVARFRLTLDANSICRGMCLASQSDVASRATINAVTDAGAGVPRFRARAVRYRA